MEYSNIDFVPDTEEEAFQNFYKYQRKNFIKVINCMLLGEKVKLRTKRAYNFDEENTEFILFILKNFTSVNMKLLRKGNADNIDSQFLIKMIDGFINLLKSSDIDCNKKNKIIEKIYDYYSYNERKLRITTKELYNSIEHKLKIPNERDFITANDKILWTNHLNQTLKVLIKIYNDIYGEIIEYRKEEVIDNAFENVSKASKNDNLIFMVIAEIQKKIEEDSEIKKLNSSINKIINSKTGFVEEQKPFFDKLSLKLSKRKDNIENDVCKTYGIDKSMLIPYYKDFNYKQKSSAEIFFEILNKINNEYKKMEKPYFSVFKNEEEKEFIKSLINQNFNIDLDKIIEEADTE